MSNGFVPIEEAIADIRQGKMIILVDDEHRENEGDLCIAAEKITPDAINFMAKYGRGLICLPMAAELIEQLQIPMMVQKNHSKFGTAFTASIEAAQGISTGISAYDRSHTIKTAVAVGAVPSDISMPGHVFPLRAKDGGVLERTGQTEGSVDLAKLAGLRPAAVVCEVMNEDGTMARVKDLKRFSSKHDVKMVSIQDLIAYRMQHEKLIEEVASARLPIHQYGDFEIKVFSDKAGSYQHVALIKGKVNNDKPCLVRLHSECLTGDVFGSARCDCGWQLHVALAKIAGEGGVLLYMNGHEGRGIGLANKIKAYALQEQGLDTVEANHQLGFPADQRNYCVCAQILQHLDIKKIRLLTNNPKKVSALQGYGIDLVGREPIEMPATDENSFYLKTKQKKLGHLLTLSESAQRNIHHFRKVKKKESV